MSGEDRTGGYFWGTGRRKCATARVRLRPGHGAIQVNGRPIAEFFHKPTDQASLASPLAHTKLTTAFDVFVTVSGGGTTGQAEAARMGIARALLLYDRNLEKPLRQEGYLTRDSRMVERKKYGRAGARRAYQFSKR